MALADNVKRLAELERQRDAHFKNRTRNYADWDYADLLKFEAEMKDIDRKIAAQKAAITRQK